MAQEIVDVSGQGGTQIIQTLFNEKGVRTSLADLKNKTGAESDTKIPRFIFVEDGVVTGGSDSMPSQQPVQTAMDLKPADIVQETKIDRQPIPRPTVTNNVQQDLDILELTDDSIKSALQQNLEPEPVVNTVNQTDLAPPTVLEDQGEIVTTDTAESKKTQFPKAGLRPLLGSDQQFIALTDPVTTYLFENTLSSLGLPYALDNNGDFMYRSPEEMSGLETEAKASVNNTAQTLGFDPVFVENQKIEKAVLEVVKNLPEGEKDKVNKSTINQNIEKAKEAVKNFLMPDPEPNMDVAEKAIEIADKEASPVVEQTVTETVSKTPDTEEQPLTQVSTTDIKKLADEGQISNETKEAFDGVLEGGFEFFGNSAVIKKIDKEIEANRIKLQEISSGKIKPYFGKEDTGKKIMAAIAAGLGAYASAMTGTPNSALQILNDAIDRDLAVQKDNLERQRLSIIDQNDYLQQQKADLLAYAELELDRMSTIAGTKNDALKDQIALLKGNQELVINTNKIEKQEREENEYQFSRNVTLKDGESGEFSEDFSTDQIKGKKKEIMTFVEGYDVLMGAPTLAGRLALSLNVPSFSDTYNEKGGVESRKFGDKKLASESTSRVIDGLVITDDMIPGASSVDLTKRGIIDQLKELADEDTIEIVAGGKLTPSGVKIMQLDTFLRNYYQRYIMVTGANLTGTEVTQVNDILPRPTKYAIASGNYLKGLEATKAALDSLYANRVLRYVKPRPQEKTRTAKPKSKLNRGELELVGEAN